MKDNIFVIVQVAWVQFDIGGHWTLDLVTGAQLHISVQLTQLVTMIWVLTVKLELESNIVTSGVVTCHWDQVTTEDERINDLLILFIAP